MAKNKQKNSSFTTKKGDVYNGTLSGGKLKVTIQRTARGQNMLVGVLDLASKEWHNAKTIPNEVRLHFEDKFAPADNSNVTV